ncbi:MAG: hypothetical protein IAF02_15035 [Anaerolineae bacterium]|nr:hypothetical protein [Anaerolineae bacterium]
MKNLRPLVLILTLIFAFMLTACDEGSYEDDYDQDETYEDEAPLTEADCYEDETYDPETQTCTIDIVCEDDAECDLILAELYTDDELANLEFYALTADDCLPGETYDPDEQTCYIECDTDAECDALAEEIYSDLDVYFNDSYNGRSDSPTAPASKSPVNTTTNTPDDLSNGDPDLPTIARYTLDGNLDITLAGLDDSQPDAQINQQRHQEIWAFLRQILPADLLLSDVSEYHIFTDGTEEILAYVSPLPDDPNHWLIGIDIADAGTTGKVNTRDFVHTTIHEFAHILTLEDAQVPPDTSLSAAEIEDGVESEVALACTTFYTGEGCALNNAYINQFFNKFWADVYYNEFQDVEWAETDEEYEDALLAFYEARPDWFVTEYAATNPGEDIAESFTYFVLQEKPTGSSIADQKVRFFYDYPALVAMRNHMRSELARMK